MTDTIIPKLNNLNLNNKQENLQNNITKDNIKDDMKPKKIKTKTIVTKRRKSSIKKIINYKDYLDLENKKLLNSYGPGLYEYAKEIEKDSNFEKILKNHDISPQMRTKLVDWMFEVLIAYSSAEATVFLCLHLFDVYLYRTKNLTNNDLHLIGISCMFLASKFEDYIPLNMNITETKIGHKKFSTSEIKKQEKKILEVIKFDLTIVSSYNFIETYIYDFKQNNASVIEHLKMGGFLEDFQELAIYLAKLIMHNENFSCYKYSLRAIACIVCSYDLLRSHGPKKFNEKMQKYMNEWINFLMLNSDYDAKIINDLYNEIAGYTEVFDNLKNIKHNVKLTFDFDRIVD